MYNDMNKQELVTILRGLLKADASLDFLFDLKKENLEKLVAMIRDRIEGCS
jgi:hypothetical protein